MEDVIKKNWVLFLIEGFAFVILGFLAVMLPMLSTLSVTFMIGWLFLLGGLVQGYRVFASKDHAAFWPALAVSVLSILAGAMLLYNPVGGTLTLTMLLSIFFFLEGIAKTVLALHIRPVYPWGWILFSGITAILLALIIWSGWPGTAEWVMGLLVGINMIFFGWSLIGLSLAARVMNK